MDRSVIFRLSRAISDARSESGFWRKSIQAAIGLIRDGGIREFFLYLLINAGKFQQHQRPRHKSALLVRQSAKGFHGIIGLASTGRNERHLILGHGRKLLIAAAADFL